MKSVGYERDTCYKCYTSRYRNSIDMDYDSELFTVALQACRQVGSDIALVVVPGQCEGCRLVRLHLAIRMKYMLHRLGIKGVKNDK